MAVTTNDGTSAHTFTIIEKNEKDSRFIDTTRSTSVGQVTLTNKVQKSSKISKPSRAVTRIDSFTVNATTGVKEPISAYLVVQSLPVANHTAALKSALINELSSIYVTPTATATNHLGIAFESNS